MANGHYEMVDPVGVIMREIADPRITQASVAITYAFVIRQLGNSADYAAINAAIMQRWRGKTALTRIKEVAWKHMKEARNG